MNQEELLPSWARTHIEGLLRGIEEEENVTILFAVESGSRAWGFPSPDSDYDARFVYIRPAHWYLAVEDRRDVIEKPIIDDFDTSGWDLRKALQLLLKPNPVLLEWLSSPIWYRSEDWVVARLRGLADRVAHRNACRHHYLHLAEGQYRRSLADRDQVAVKKYFYALRPVLALMWLRTNETGRVPMSLPELLEGVQLPPDVAGFLDNLRERKRHTKELGLSPKIDVLDRFIVDEIELARANAIEPKAPDRELLSDINRLMVDVVQAFDCQADQVR